MIQLFRSDHFKKMFGKLPIDIQDRTGDTLERFLSNARHPSLHVKKMEGSPDIWEMRVTENYRITFQYVREGILLRKIGTHDVLRHP